MSNIKQSTKFPSQFFVYVLNVALYGLVILLWGRISWSSQSLKRVSED